MLEKESTSADQTWFAIALERGREVPIGLPPSVQILCLRPEEVPPSFERESLAIVASGFPERSWDPKSIHERVLNRERLVRLVTAREDQSLIGLTTVHTMPDPNAARLHWLAVADSHRRRGIGRALVMVAAREASAEGFSRMVLKTENYRTDAIAFYQRLGFTELAT